MHLKSGDLSLGSSESFRVKREAAASTLDTWDSSLNALQKKKQSCNCTWEGSGLPRCAEAWVSGEVALCEYKSLQYRQKMKPGNSPKKTNFPRGRRRRNYNPIEICCSPSQLQKLNDRSGVCRRWANPKPKYPADKPNCALWRVI